MYQFDDSKMTVLLGDKTIDLTLEEAKKLKRIIDGWLAGAGIIPYTIYPVPLAPKPYEYPDSSITMTTTLPGDYWLW